MATKSKQPENLPKNLAKAVKVETVDFNDPNRPLTCLEVDFPIAQINELSALEGNAGKPVYQMSKWWARRRSSIFRSMLIAAATKAPEDKTKAAQYVWDLYYANHQKAGNFTDLKVMDIFMGGGTTLVEGARLGFDVYGNDLNPVAWFVTKNELTPVDPKEVEKAFDEIEAEVKPQIMPFYTTTCPRGHKGYWIDKATDKKMPEDFDPIDLHFEERKKYEYTGPEIIYTFWGKHGHCIDEKCQHRTPVFNSHVIAIKDISVKYQEIECPGCKNKIHFEQQEVRIAPESTFIVNEEEIPFITAGSKTEYNCPSCKYKLELYLNDCKKSKKINLTLLISPEWLKGSPGIDKDGLLGGYIDAPIEKTEKWFEERLNNLELIEYRGKLPDKINNPFNKSEEIEITNATVPKKAHFTCGSCGKLENTLEATRNLNQTAPVFPYTIQCYCPYCDKGNQVYNGRYFKKADQYDMSRLIKAEKEWVKRSSEDLEDYWPKEKLPYAWMTHHLNGGIPNWGYTHWYKMFNSRQLLIHSQILNFVITNNNENNNIVDHLIGGYQQYLRNQNMFCFYNLQADKMEPFMSNNNYHPKMQVIENNFAHRLGRGNWNSIIKNSLKGINWIDNPYEIYIDKNSNGSSKVNIPDSFADKSKNLTCKSSTDLADYINNSFDLVITDPPFGDNIFYADLADFFYMWLRIPLSETYPQIYNSEFTPKSQEAITNKAEHPDTRTKVEKENGVPHPADEFYKNSLTACYSEAYRILKDGGIMAFTFHHNQFEAWIAVLEALFDAGFILEGTYPIRSDETKGEKAAFGSKKIEYDIIHVCRKRLNPPEQVSWAKMRRWLKQEVDQLRTIIELYRKQNLLEADIKIILWGKFLEFYSKHYGQVYTAENEVLSVKDAILGITQMLDDESKEEELRPPQLAEPITRLFLQVFFERSEITRDEFHKTLRGTGHSPEDFKDLGWVKEERKIFYKIAIPEAFQELTKSGKRRDTIKKDLDQAYFLLGAALDKTNKINILDELKDSKFEPKKAVDDILLWVAETDLDENVKDAARKAHKLVVDWRSKKASSAPKEDSLQLSLLLDS